MMDKDGSGTLTTEEFLSIPDLALNPLLERILQIFDLNGDDEIQFSEFISVLSTLSDKGTKQDKLRFAFQVYDILCNYPPPSYTRILISLTCQFSITVCPIW